MSAERFGGLGEGAARAAQSSRAPAGRAAPVSGAGGRRAAPTAVGPRSARGQSGRLGAIPSMWGSDAHRRGLDTHEMSVGSGQGRGEGLAHRPQTPAAGGSVDDEAEEGAPSAMGVALQCRRRPHTHSPPTHARHSTNHPPRVLSPIASGTIQQAHKPLAHAPKTASQSHSSFPLPPELKRRHGQQEARGIRAQGAQGRARPGGACPAHRMGRCLGAVDGEKAPLLPPPWPLSLHIHSSASLRPCPPAASERQTGTMSL